MQSINLVKVDDVRFFVDLLMQIDEDAYAILRQATIPNDIHGADSYEYLPESALKNALEVLAEHYSKQQLALIFWQSIRERYMPAFIKELAESDTVLDASHELTKLMALASPGANVYPSFIAGCWWLVREKQGQHELWYEYGEMFSVLFLIEFIRSITQLTWKPEQIALVSSSSDAYKALPTMDNIMFIHQRAVTGVKISDEVMQQAITVNSRGKSSFGLSNSLLAKNSLYLEPSFLSTFKMAISPYLSMGKLPITLAAEILRMNVRTLQRRLADHKLIYKELIEEMTFELILAALKDDAISITTIATRFGYSDGAHFTRAFKRRMGMTPRQYRMK
ncbi:MULTISPECIES: helix-turn-helix transcriptional regulator [unclassified Vibrio]|uniref:helix-turn-helix transcriptional regulator n=1 Tax=unclassified Vibrio TaxID=2614977 RepID=UPI000A746E12|nr:MULTISPECIES: helix-turn-helix transcriptional regulator [unclassified Vibrio]